MSEAEALREIVIPSDATGTWRYRTAIYASDGFGVTLAGLRTGDVVKIRRILGWCTFSDKSTARKVAGLVSAVVPLLPGGGVATIAKKALDAVKKDGGFSVVQGTGGKRRNGYGRVAGKDEFATKDGGIIVCMPSAMGTISARKGTYLRNGAEKHGRLPEYYPDSIKGRAFFPSRERRGQREMAASVDGPASIIVFDSDYLDNRGVYVVDLDVIRPTGSHPILP